MSTTLDDVKAGLGALEAKHDTVVPAKGADYLKWLRK